MKALHPKNAALVAVASAVLFAPFASADGLSDIGTRIAEAVSGFVTIVTAIGMAGIAVVVMVTAFKMAFSFVKTLK